MRDEILKSYNLLENLEYKNTPDMYQKSKTQACIGVRLTWNKQKNGIFYNWTAVYRVKGRDLKKHFSVRKYGNEEAFQKACEVRYQQVGPIRVKNKDLLPCKPKVPFVII
jgi:hypothetical protein